MKKLPMMIAAITLTTFFAGPVFAQDTSPSTMPSAQDQQTTPTSQTTPSQSSAAPQTADLTGQTIYNRSGRQIGTVSSMSTDAQGQQVAVVSIGKYLGMGGKSVQFPVNLLSPKEGGGYTTSLNAKEIKALPPAGAH
jgi:hypothetical protein